MALPSRKEGLVAKGEKGLGRATTPELRRRLSFRFVCPKMEKTHFAPQVLCIPFPCILMLVSEKETLSHQSLSPKQIIPLFDLITLPKNNIPFF